MSNIPKEVVIIEAVRTPIGTYKGSLKIIYISKIINCACSSTG